MLMTFAANANKVKAVYWSLVVEFIRHLPGGVFLSFFASFFDFVLEWFTFDSVLNSDSFSSTFSPICCLVLGGRCCASVVKLSFDAIVFLNHLTNKENSTKTRRWRDFTDSCHCQYCWAEVSCRTKKKVRKDPVKLKFLNLKEAGKRMRNKKSAFWAQL